MLLKKLTAVGLAMTIVLSVFTGCGKKEDKPGVSTAGSDGNMVGNMYKSGVPIVKDPVVLKVLVRRQSLSKKSFSEKDIYKKFEQDSNVKIEWNEIPDTGWDEKVNLTFAAGDLPDVIYGAPIKNLDVQVEEKNVIALTELVSKWAPNYKKVLEKYPDVKKTHTFEDGNLYYLFTFDATDKFQDQYDALFMNKSWLDKLNLKAPETTDDFYQVLKSFKEKDPNGNGKADEIPFSLAQTNNNLNLRSMFGSFGILENPEHVTIKNGKVIFSPSDPGYFEALKYFNRLMSEGLMDKEIFTQNSNQLYAKGKNKEVILGSYIDWNDDNVVGTERINDYIHILPLKGPKGERMWNNRINVGSASFYITKANKYPEISIRWVDYMNEGINGLIQTMGPEGVAWKRTADGKYFENINDNVPKGGSWGELRFTEGGGGGVPSLITLETTGLDRKLDERTGRKSSWTEAARPYMAKEIYQALKKSRLTDKDKEMLLVKADIDTYLKNFMAKSIVDGISDKQWEEHLAKCKTLKTEQYTQHLQEQYDKLKAVK